MSDHAEQPPSNVSIHPAGRQGKLTTPDGAQLPVRTFEREQDVALVVMVDVDAHLEAKQLKTAVLEYTTLRGIVRLRGEAVFEGRSLIRFKAQEAAEVMQRREFVRVHAPQSVTLTAESDHADRSAHTVDVSGGGMLVSGAEVLGTGDTVDFALQLRAGEPAIEGIARVVRVAEDGKRALAFDRIGESDRERLVAFVFKCMRSAAARTRDGWI
ncbi:MAG: flagellar brake protein [Solirubrobacteraceae bacterium]